MIQIQTLEENKNLREILGISRVSDPQFEETDQYMKEKLNEFEESKEAVDGVENGYSEDDFKLTSQVIASFRQERQAMLSLQRTFSAYSDKEGVSASRIVYSSVSTDNLIEAISPVQSLNQSIENSLATTIATSSSDK